MNATEIARAIIAHMTSDVVMFFEVRESNEPFRAAVDCTRKLGIHSVEDGSDEYAAVVDALEELLLGDPADDAS